jgi:predicted 2-oxoglutarate/Fe(II)-dependent dioxygenase YbiX
VTTDPDRPYYSQVVLPGWFDAGECDRIVDLGERASAEPGVVGSDGITLDDSDIRRSSIAWLERTDADAWLWQRLDQAAAEINLGYCFDLDSIVEDLQYTVYDRPGAFYTWHQDGLDGIVADRKLALVVQLSHEADYCGADLDLFDIATDWHPDDLAGWRHEVRQRGTLVGFPGFEYHRVTPLESGRRIALVAWVSGPPFR